MSRQVIHQIQAIETLEGAGVRVLRTLGLPQLDHLDPFLLLDEFLIPDPDNSPGIPWHPHRGFETVTLILEGEALHEDRIGGKGHLRTGDVQWMTAGSGIIHQEMPVKGGPPLRGIQLWVNLPSHLKMTAPRYQDIQQSQIPEEDCQNGKVRVIAGRHNETDGIVDTHIPITYLEILLSPGGSTNLSLPPNANAFAYILEGSALFGENEFPGRHPELVVFSKGENLPIRSDEGTRLLVIAAEPLNEPIARHGPFVMNSREELMQAFVDYQNGTLMRASTDGGSGEKDP
jgi:redox-sensitive bicupin YhaK (pirin superfamily)